MSSYPGEVVRASRARSQGPAFYNSGKHTIFTKSVMLVTHKNLYETLLFFSWIVRLMAVLVDWVRAKGDSVQFALRGEGSAGQYQQLDLGT